MAYVSHFCILTETPKHLETTIENTTKPLRNSFATLFSNAYMTFSVACFLVAVGFLFFGNPQSVRGFWPISLLSASAGDLEQPVLHDESIPLLKAATHSDPDPSKGTVAIAVSDGSALVSNAGPDGSFPTTYAVPNAGQISVYTVREGDALSEIARMYGVSINTILWANDIKKAANIKQGDELIILPVSGLQYTVKKGDTLKSIAKKYSGDADDIGAYNGIESDAELIAGNDIIIPGGELASAPAKAQASGSGSVAKISVALPAVSGVFGNPVPNGRLTQGLHGYNGVDIGAPYGSPIYAAAAGKVTVARGSGYNGGYGLYVVISHDNGAQTLYAHMSSVAATQGASVGKGDVIGYVGSTGLSTGNHVHFEVRGGWKNPFAR